MPHFFPFSLFVWERKTVGLRNTYIMACTTAIVITAVETLSFDYSLRETAPRNALHYFLAFSNCDRRLLPTAGEMLKI